MNLNQPTLVQFESERRANNFILPTGSNSFYNIGDGEINLLVKRDDPDDYRFSLFTNSGHVYTGDGNFIIAGDINDTSLPYESLTVIDDTKLSVNNTLTVSKGTVDIYGSMELMQNSKLIIKDGAKVIFHPDSLFIIKNDASIILENLSSLVIYGQVDIHISAIDSLLNITGITIDSAAVMNVDGINFDGRSFSLTDYYTELRDKTININTQGEKNFIDNRIGYTWMAGDPRQSSWVIDMGLLWGETILGDFKLSLLGIPETVIQNSQILSSLTIRKNTTLHITEHYNNFRFVRPELYIGVVIGNTETPGNCEIYGSVIVEGKNSSITLDRGGSMHIAESGSLYLFDGSTLKSAYNEGLRVLTIDGLMVIETIDQIITLSTGNIVFGEKGRLIILNPDTGKRKLLWTTPNGIKDSDLYRILGNNLEHVQYHICKNNGIGIDEYYEFYNREMTVWYAGRRIEQAIHEGLIVWHDEAFIELYSNITPWVDMNCTLLHASRIFKTFGSYDKDKLQDAVNRLTYAGCGNILFRFIDGNNEKEVLLTLDGSNMKSVYNYPLTDMYNLKTDNDGTLFIRNKIPNTNIDTIVNKKSRTHDIVNNEVSFLC